ncbi:MAG: biotin--[acetyl-CoA-carboxylase] ligase [Thiotrichaceae bacterium]|nr:biotin--[acetyl-CoA-carboxylase] ligase [Thiotrichaceae bacterium]
MLMLDKYTILSCLDDHIRSQLGKLWVFNQIGSTNQWLMDSNECCAVCVAEQQSSGRGRRGRFWQSDDKGNIYFSMSWCISESTLEKIQDKLPLLSLSVGLELCALMADFGLNSHGLKWPNDILVKGRKLAGILIETTNNRQRLVIGIGINVGQESFDSSLNATSLALELPEPVDRNVFIAMIIQRLFKHLLRFPQLSYHDVLSHWEHWDLLKGKEVNVYRQVEEKILRGLATGINAQGELQLLLENGDTLSVNAAEVSVRW